VTRKEETNLQKLFPELKEKLSKKLKLIKVNDLEKWISEYDFKGVNVVFSCVGTSRQYPEVAHSIAQDGDIGFAHWLSKIDVNISTKLAQAAFHNGVKVVARVSAINADANNNESGFGVYFKHQGIADDKMIAIQEVKEKKVGLVILRPGELDRGELMEERDWERDGFKENPDHYLPVQRVAKAMIVAVSKELKHPAGARIVELQEIISLSNATPVVTD